MAPEPAPTPTGPGLRGSWLAACCSAALLVLVALDGRARDPAIDTSAFHLRVSEAAEHSLPMTIGDWVGTKIPTPMAATKILNPNALVNRRYRNSRTGESVSLLFVHCSDARDLVGHYPPICYPSNGMTKGPSEQRDWEIGGMRISAMRYRFLDARFTTSSEMVVDNFMVIPTDGPGRDMESVGIAAKDRRRRVYGAAQVQVVNPGEMGDARRDEVFRTLIEAALPLLASLKVEVSRE